MGELIRLARPLVGPEEISAVTRILESGHLVQGAEVAAFEEEFSALVGDRPCVAVSSGTSALVIALLVAEIGPGDEVIVPSFTFAATANAVRLAGATPVFADIEPDTYCLDPEAVRAAVSPRTAAIMPVHLYGHPAADELREVASSHHLALVEDAAQAHGASLGRLPVGAWGTTAAFSFYATKNMTTGEGGMVVVADPALARRARLLRNQGMERQYENEVVGYNVRLTDMAAAVGRVQLRRLAERTARRQVNAARLDDLLSGHVGIPPVMPGAVHVYHQYTVRIADGRRDEVEAALRARDVESKVFYPVPVHRLPAFAVELDLPVTEQATREVLSVPVGPHLSDEDVETVGSAVAEVAIS